MAQGFTGSQTIVTGSGGANRVAVWASTSSLTSDGNFTYASGTLAIANGKIQANGDGSSYGLYAGANADVQWYDDTTQSFFVASDTWRSTVPVIVNGIVYSTSSVFQSGLSGTSGGFIAGAGAGFVQLYQNTSDRWQTDNEFKVNGTGLIVTNAATFSARTATRVAYFGTAGLLSDDSGLVWDATNDQLQLPTTGSGAGLLVGGDVQWYRSAANVWNTPDSVIIQGGLNVGTVTTATNYAHIKTANTIPITCETTANNGGQVQFINAASTPSDWRLGVPGVANSRDFFWYDNSSGGAQTTLYATAATGNIGIGNSTAFGTSAARTLRMPGPGASAAAPTSSVTDYFHIYGADAAAGKAWPSFREEGNTGTTRYIMGVSATTAAGATARATNGSTAAANAGWITTHDHAGNTIYIPYWNAT